MRKHLAAVILAFGVPMCLMGESTNVTQRSTVGWAEESMFTQAEKAEKRGDPLYLAWCIDATDHKQYTEFLLLKSGVYYFLGVSWPGATHGPSGQLTTNVLLDVQHQLLTLSNHAELPDNHNTLLVGFRSHTNWCVTTVSRQNIPEPVERLLKLLRLREKPGVGP